MSPLCALAPIRGHPGCQQGETRHNILIQKEKKTERKKEEETKKNDHQGPPGLQTGGDRTQHAHANTFG